MNIQAFYTFRDSVYNALDSRRLLDAIETLKELAVFTQNNVAAESLYALRQDYAMLLGYMKSGRDDDERQQHFDDFVRQAYMIADKMCRKFVLRHVDCQESHIAQRLKGPVEAVADIYVPFVEGQNGKAATISQVIADPLASYQQVFDTVWVSGSWSSEQRREYEAYVMDVANPRLNRLAMVSAAALAVLLAFDEEKVLFLLGVIEEHQVEISVRALTLFLLVYSVNRSRISLYPAIQIKLRFLAELTYFHPLFVEVQKQILLALENPRLAAKIDEELPERLMSAHKQVKQLSKEATQEDIESFLENNPKARRFHREMISMMHDFVVMQEKGVDMSYQTFSHIQPITPFFREAANWFCPFSFEHPILFGVNAAARFFSVVVNNKACDTERFAVFFTIAPHLPEIHVVQQNMVTMEEQKMEGEEAQSFIEHLADQMEKEEAEGEHSLLTIKPGRLHRYVVSCVQDCFRFFMLYAKPYKADVQENDPVNVIRQSVYPVKESFSTRINPFEGEIWFWTDGDFWDIFVPEDIRSDLARWVFELEDYESAITLFHDLPHDGDLLARRAYAFEQLGSVADAISDYKLALQLDPENEWLLLQLFSCYREKLMFGEAAELLERYLEKNPENLRYSRLLADVYMRNEDYDKARTVYIKNDYLHPGHVPTLRGLAWCNLALGDYDKANEIYLKILASDKVKANDYFNAGHCALLHQDVPSAILCYQEYLRMNSMEYADSSFFGSDSSFLAQRGINENTQRLLVDLLNINI